MLRKVFVAGGVLLLGGWLWAKTDLGSYVHTAFNQIRGTVKKQVPMSFEIKRAKDMLAGLDAEVDKIIGSMANQMVLIEREDKSTADRQGWLDKEEKALKSLNSDLKSDKKVLFNSIGEVSRDRFARDLERRFNRYKMHQEAMKSKKDSLLNHKERLAADKEQLDSLRAVRTDLQARIEKLETQYAALQLAETRSRHRTEYDESALASVKELIDTIETDLQKRLYQAQLQEELRPAAAVPMTPKVNITEEIDALFGEDKAANVVTK